MSHDEADSLVSRGVTAEVAVSVLIETDALQERISQVQCKVTDLKRLQAAMINLRQCFVELAALVDSQGGIADSIEFSIINTKNFLGQAGVALKSAALKQRRQIVICAWVGICLLVSITTAGLIILNQTGLISNASLVGEL
jgi:t-SNARE complex subunit (syntaxin)